MGIRLLTVSACPRLSGSFRRDEKLGIYLKAYNFAANDKTRKPSGSVEYEVQTFSRDSIR